MQNKSSLRQHENRHAAVVKYKCETCGLPTFGKAKIGIESPQK